MRDPRLSRTRHGDGLFALDMSSNLTHCSEYTTLLRMHPLDCFCCEVEAALLSPFSLHARSCATLSMLLLLVVLFFSIVTCIVVSCLLNVVNSFVKCRDDILLIHSFLPVSHLFQYSCSFHFIIHCILLLKLTDHMFRPCQITYRFPSIISFKRKVTSPDEELRTILCHALIFHSTDEKFGLFTF